MKSLRWWFVPGVAGIVWMLQWLRNAIPPFADIALSFDGDVALHILLGELMLAQGGFLATEPTNYLMEGQPFIAHEWLAQVTLALAHRAFGPAGPTLLAAGLLATLSVVILRRSLRVGAGVWPAILVLVAVFTVQNTHLHPRPHLVTWILAFVFTTWLERVRTGDLDARGWLLRALPTMVLWAQLHAGFLIVAPLLLAYVGGALIEALGEDREGALRRAGTFAGGGALLLAITGLNPWGFALHAHFLDWLGNDWMTSFTTEFQSPDFRSLAGRFLLGYLLLGWLGLSGSRQRPDASNLLLFLGLTAMALHAARHGAIFATCTAPFVALQLQRALDGFRDAPTPLGRLASELDASSRRLGAEEAVRGGWGLAAGLAVATVLAVGVMGRPAVQWHPALQPTQATAWIEAHQDELPGRMFNPFQWGAYLAYRLFPDQQTFINSWHDHLGERALRTYFVVHEARPGWRDVLEEHGVGWIVYGTRSELARVLDADQDWDRVYRDATASVWVHRQTRDQLAAGAAE